MVLTRLLLICVIALWPLFHYLLWQDVATEYASADAYWSPYVATNEAFVQKVVEVYQPGAFLNNLVNSRLKSTMEQVI